MTRSLLGLFFLTVSMATATVSGCNFGGLNDNVHQPGDEPGGVKISAGDIAVAPSGDYFLFERDGALVVGWVDSGQVEELPVRDPARLAFSKARQVVYVTTQRAQLVAVDIERRSTLWSASVAASTDPMVVASDDDERVAVGSGLSVLLFDAHGGAQIASRTLSEAVVDIEVLPDDERLIVIERHDWTAEGPSTTVHIVGLATGEARDFPVPNCSDDVVVPSHGRIALLAPTTCQQDPISHLDLTAGAERFVRNLPGFGPVAMGPDGVTAVGFLDTQNVDETLFDDPAEIPPADQRYHLMVIDTESLGYDFYAFGQGLPRYAITPDGSILLVDQWQAAGSARLFDLTERSFVSLSGPAISFEHLAFSGDSRHAYLLSDPEAHAEVSSSSQESWTDYELFDLDIAEAAVMALPTSFRPRNVNIAPGADKLFLRQDGSTICIYSLASKSCERVVTLVTAE